MLDDTFSEEIFPNTQSKPPLAELEAICSRPITCYLRKETDTHFTTTSFQVAVENDKVPLQPLFLQTKQSQFPQSLLMRLLLLTSHQPCSSSLDTLQQLHVFLVVRGPKMNTVLQVWSHQCKYRGTITSLLWLATLFLIEARMLSAFLATCAHCWLMFSQLSTNNPRSFSTRQVSSHSSPSM